jgi:hypothetical protein
MLRTFNRREEKYQAPSEEALLLNGDLKLQEEELFRQRQQLIHQAICQESLGGLPQQYLQIRAREAEVRLEQLRFANLLHPGHASRDYKGIFNPENMARKIILLVVLIASAMGLFLYLW